MKKITGRILVLLCCLLAAVGCRNNGNVSDVGGSGLALSVAIDQGSRSKAPIEGSAFADGEHLFGLAVTKPDELTAYEAGSSHVWSRAVITGATQTWTYQWGSMAAAGAVLPQLNTASAMRIAAYYPYHADAAALAGRDGGRLNVPFDLTAAVEQGNQTDVMYSSAQTLIYAAGGNAQRVSLLFRHVYAMFEFQVKLSDATSSSTITKVEVCNKAGKDFLKNKGFFSPYTGALTASDAGNVSVTSSAVLNATGYTTIQVMVPPTLLADYQDGDIYVQFYDDGLTDPKQFPILGAYLTQTGLYGLAGGGKYRFKLLYDNRVWGSLTVLEWTNTSVDEEPLGAFLIYDSPSATTPVDKTATSVAFTVTGSKGLILSLAKTGGDGAFSDPSPATLTCDGTAQRVTVTMPANPGAARQATYSATVTNAGAAGLSLTNITVKQEGLPINPPTVDDYVEINGLKWTKGNLVAKNNNECKVGASTDNGVYFQFGSLVGWSSGASGNGVGTGTPALDQAVWPSDMGATKPTYTWPTKNVANTSELANYYFNYSVGPWATDGVNSDIGTFAVSVSGEGVSTGTLRGGRYANLGVGDPCSYYLGAPWRMPTAAEYAALNAVGQGGWVISPATGRWFGTNPGTESSSVFFRAAGSRDHPNGTFFYVGSSGEGWSSSVSTATGGYHLSFNSGNVSQQYPSLRSYGLPVRCVSE